METIEKSYEKMSNNINNLSEQYKKELLNDVCEWIKQNVENYVVLTYSVGYGYEINVERLSKDLKTHFK